MSVSIDANILVYADNVEDPVHELARGLLGRLAAGPDLLYLFWPTLLGYLRIATSSRILRSPTTPADAIANIDGLFALPHVVVPGEQPGFWRAYIESGGATARGNAVPDLHLATLMRENGVRILYTRDRGFRRFDFLDVRDPFTHKINEGTR
ncbi:MAG: TA system VapC family ribonuclease toxin [Chloroflexota bacterium]